MKHASTYLTTVELVSGVPPSPAPDGIVADVDKIHTESRNYTYKINGGN